MPNHYVFNENDQPVYVEMTNTFRSPDIAAPPEMSASENAALFSVNASASATVILGLSSAIISVRLANPAGSGRTVYISQISGSIGGSSMLSAMSGTFTIARGGALTAPGTLIPVNNNLASAASGSMTVQSSAAAVSGGTVLYTYQLAPGAFTQVFTGSIVIPPGGAISVSVSSSSSSVGLTITSALGFTWWER